MLCEQRVVEIFTPYMPYILLGSGGGLLSFALFFFAMYKRYINDLCISDEGMRERRIPTGPQILCVAMGIVFVYLFAIFVTFYFLERIFLFGIIFVLGVIYVMFMLFTLCKFLMRGVKGFRSDISINDKTKNIFDSENNYATEMRSRLRFSIFNDIYTKDTYKESPAIMELEKRELPLAVTELHIAIKRSISDNDNHTENDFDKAMYNRVKAFFENTMGGDEYDRIAQTVYMTDKFLLTNMVNDHGIIMPGENDEKLRRYLLGYIAMLIYAHDPESLEKEFIRLLGVDELERYYYKYKHLSAPLRPFRENIHEYNNERRTTASVILRRFLNRPNANLTPIRARRNRLEDFRNLICLYMNSTYEERRTISAQMQNDMYKRILDFAVDKYDYHEDFYSAIVSRITT